MSQTNLIQILIARQRGASDRRFARTLGVSVTRWCEIKAGASPGLDFLRAVLAVYPDLWIEAAAYLSPDAGERAPAEASVLTDRSRRLDEEVPA